MSTIERDSGAGAYSNSWVMSVHAHVVGAGVVAGAELLALQEQVVEQTGGAEAEPVRVQPVRAHGLVDEHQVLDGVLRRPDAAGGLDAHLAAGGGAEVAHRLEHHQADRQRGGGGDLAGGGLDEVAAGQHRQPGGPADGVEGDQLPGLQDDLEVRGPAGLLDRDDLLEDVQVAPGQERAPVDDHVDLVGTVGHGVPDVGELHRPAGPAAGERGGDRGDVDAGARQRLLGDARQVAVDADRGDGRAGRVLGVGPAGLGGERAHLARGVRALQRGQVDHRDGGVDRPGLGGGLDRAGAQHLHPVLRTDLVDAGETVQERAEGVVRAGHVGERVRQGARGGAGIGQRVRVQHVGHARHSPLLVTRTRTGRCRGCGTVDHMAPPTRRSLSRRIPWTTAVPLLALLVLVVSWGRYPPTVLAVLIGVVLMGAVLAAVHHAEVVAHRVGEPFGSLVLAVAVTIIEVALIVTLMVSGGDDTATLARDTVFAAVMITCNGIVGLSLLLGALRHGMVSFNAEGTGAALATVTTLAVLSLVLPTFATAASGPQFPPSQLAFAAVASLLLYGAFVLTQTVRHRDFFLPVTSDGSPVEEEHAEPPTSRAALVSLGLLLVALVAVVGLAKVESPAIEDLVAAVGFPQSFVGVVIALLVLLPETVAAARAARRDRLQISLNLAFGSAMASIGLTIPAIAVASIWLEGPLLLGLGATQTALLAVTVVVGTLTVVPGRATRLQGAVHLVLLAAFLFLAVNP